MGEQDRARGGGPSEVDKWAAVAVILVAVGLAGYGGWWWLSNRADVDGLRGDVLPWVELVLRALLVFLLALLVGKVLVLLVRWERRKRAEVVERLVTALEPVTGRPAKGDLVRVTRWRGHTVRRIRVSYGPGFDDDAASSRAQVRTVIETKTGARWAAEWDTKRDRVVLVRDESRDDSPEKDAQLERTEKVLHSALAGARSVRVTAWTAEHTPARIEASYIAGPKVASERYRQAVQQVVASTFPGRWRTGWDTEHDRVVFELRPGLPRLARRPRDLPPPSRPVLRYGVDEDGDPQAWPLDGTAPHCLVVGPTGGGKTYCLRAMALDAISQGVDVYGLDPKRIELMGLIGVPGVVEVATDVEAMAVLIVRLHTLMEERYAQIERREATRADLAPILFILDEFFILRMRLNRAWQADPDTKGKEHPVLGLVWELLALARSARIHLAIGIQRPDAEFVDGPARDNLRHRVSLSQLSPHGAAMMWGDQTTGTDLPDVPGRAVASRNRSGDSPSTDVAHEIQVWALPDPDPWRRDQLSEQDRDELEQLFAGARSPAGQQEHRPGGPPAVAAATEPEGEPDETRGELSRAADEGGHTAAWSSVRVEELVEEDVVRIEGQPGSVVGLSEDPSDEDYVQLEWKDRAGAVSCLAVSRDELIDRAA